MGTTLIIICLFLVTHLHAESTAAPDSNLSSSDATTSSSLFDVDEELAKIAASCLTNREHGEISGNLFKYGILRFANNFLLKAARVTIGLNELRDVLGFAPLGPWTNYNFTEPSADELAATPTIEDYYNLKEPRYFDCSLDSYFHFEKNLPPAIAFLDKRFPAIRKIFRLKFEENLDAGRTIDRKTVDHMIDEYRAISTRLYSAIEGLTDLLKCEEYYLHAESIAPSSTTASISTSTTSAPDNSLSSADPTTSSSVFNVDEELAKVKASCLTSQDIEQLWGNSYRYKFIMIVFKNPGIMAAEQIIGLTELRAVLGFAPPGPWTKYNRKKPSAEELAAAPTIEDYYNLREPRNQDRSLDSEYFYEKNFPPVIAFLDKRLPTIRKIFRHKFEESLRLDAGRTIDRETVDHMIKEYRVIYSRVLDAMGNILSYSSTLECSEGQ